MSSAQMTAPISSVFTSLGYQEDEVKLNAPDNKTLESVWWHIINDEQHFVPSYNTHVNPQLPEDKGLARLTSDKPRILMAPRSITKIRYRYYFDTRLRDLFRAKVEVRLEPKDGAFKQVIKMGNGATIDNPMMGRPEYPARLKKFRPSLGAIEKKEDDRQTTIDFLRSTVKKKGRLKPVVRIESQRLKLEYHPQGDRNVTIEVGIDKAVGMNVAGFEWDVRQIELEVKENLTNKPNSDILEADMAILMAEYPSLVIETTSKPTLGFNNMAERKVGLKRWGKLPCDRFTVTDKFPMLSQ